MTARCGKSGLRKKLLLKTLRRGNGTSERGIYGLREVIIIYNDDFTEFIKTKKRRKIMNSKDMIEIARILGMNLNDFVELLGKFERLTPSQSIKMAMELQNRAVMKLEGIAK
jgi:hypothetical protein